MFHDGHVNRNGPCYCSQVAQGPMFPEHERRAAALRVTIKRAIRRALREGLSSR